MTSHRLIRCTAPRLLEHAAAVHPEQLPEADRARLPHWRDHPAPPHRSVVWRQLLPDGSVLGWCLEVEQGANGVLAHLGAATLAGPASRLPRTLRRLALRPWTDHELTELARAVEDPPRLAPSTFRPEQDRAAR